MDNRKNASIIGAALDLGQSRRGVDMGPSAIRYSGLEQRLTSLGIDVLDEGDVMVEIPEIAHVQDTSARYLPTILLACSQIAERVKKEIENERTPIVLGGDHSIAMGTLAGLHSAFGTGGVMWVDAHADMNRPDTSPSGNVHGMPLAAALGTCGFDLQGMPSAPWVDPARVALVGIRDLDEQEKALVRSSGVSAFTMTDIDRRGIAAVVREAIEIVEGDGFFHVSFDVDSCDPEIAPGVGTPVMGGLSYREAHLAMELVAERNVMTSIEVVEVNPILDVRNITGALAVELVASAMGATIL